MLSSLLPLISHFLLPAFLCFWLWQTAYRSRFDWLLVAVLVGGYVGMMYFSGNWYMFTDGWRYLIPILYLAATVRSALKVREQPFWRPKNNRERFGVFFLSFFAVLFGALTLWAVAGRYYGGEALSLQFPLQNGRFAVAEGGNSPLLNMFFNYWPLPEKYSVSLVKLDDAGRRADGIHPPAAADYFIVGEPVYSPLAGKVVSVVDTLPDHSLTEAVEESDDFLGNRIVISAGNHHVHLTQLQTGSIAVNAGDSVRTGQLIARAGSSGWFFEPHLHIYATREKPDPREGWDREGVPVLFNGRFPVKNDVFDIRPGSEPHAALSPGEIKFCESVATRVNIYYIYGLNGLSGPAL